MSKFSFNKLLHSRAVRTFLAALCVICFGLVGVIAGYAPAYGFISLGSESYGMDAFLADDFQSSEYFRDRVSEDYYRVKNCFSVKKHSYITARLNSTGLQAWGRVDGYESSTDNYSLSDEKHCITVSGSGVSGTLMSDRDYSFSRDFIGTDDYVKFGYSEHQYIVMKQYWLDMKQDMGIIITSVISLAAAGLVLLILSCCHAGEDKYGNAVLRGAARTPYEITLAPALGGLAVSAMALLGYFPVSTFCTGANARMIYMLFCGAITALTASFALLFCVCFVVRRKTKKALEGSIILVALRFVGRCIVRFLRFIKEVFTGEAFAAKTVSRRLIIIDAIMAVATTVNLAFALAPVFYAKFSIPSSYARMEYFDNVFSAIVVCTVVEIVLAGLFFCGRYLIIRDEARVERLIRDIYNGNYCEMPRLSKNSPYTEIAEMLGDFSEQYRRGMEASIKSERTKIELVANVSHDLKTPLTSIIGYIELLSKEELNPEAKEYVHILKGKSERLKNIVADVFELAKTTSGEIFVEKQPLDLTKLSYQVLAELEDKIEGAGFEVKTTICDPPVTVCSDGKRIYRIIQNLIDNALKYSLKGTRIYYELKTVDNSAFITIKNIAGYEMDFTKEEILERFTRGDKSRSSEGSGLGLSIAQGFTLACGGGFDVDIDGDLFKVTVSFPLEIKEPVTADE